MLNQWLGRLYQNQDVHTGLQFEARIAQRQSLVKQLHERQLDLLITTEAPKMDEFCSQLLGYFTLALYTSAPSKLKGDLNYLRLEWGPDFQQHEAGLIGADEVPILTTSSAELAQQQIAMLNGCTGYPSVGHVKKAACIPLSIAQHFHGRFMPYGYKIAIKMR